MRRKSLAEEVKLLANEFTSPAELITIMTQHDRSVVLDHKMNDWFKVTFPAKVTEAPERYTVFTDPQALRAELIKRNMYIGMNPGGYVRFRNIPAGVQVDWATGEITQSA